MHLRPLGGEIVTHTPIRSIDELPPARAILCDLSPRPLLEIGMCGYFAAQLALREVLRG